ncbi:MAG: PTS mannitol transporter subunit IICB [Rhodoglobus sp.]
MTSLQPSTAAPPKASRSAKASRRARVQAFGGFLTAMVIPNVGAFIAWGLLTALFIPTGWIPNENLAKLVGPIITYLLPLLLAYTGGKLVHGHRGGVAGALGTVGLIVGATIPMFLGAMVMGPLSAWIIKKVDQVLVPKIRPGFEMVVNNFSLGIIGMGLCILSFEGVGPLISAINKAMLSAIEALVATGFLPILAFVNEPAKVLFLNNVIDQGMYYPLGLQQAAEAGKSIFFTVASNPGPGLGLLIAFYMFSGSKIIKDSTPGAIIIHFLGGIHEIYFPYVLMKPITIIGMIAGAATGITVFGFFGAGLVAGPSPGSIFSYLALTPKGNFPGIIAGILAATLVSFLVTAVILKIDRRINGDVEEDLTEFAERSQQMKSEGKAVLAGALDDPSSTDLKTIVFACDAGMGSSTMGASLFRKKLTAAGRDDLLVTNTSIENIPANADVVVVHKNLADRARIVRPETTIVAISNYLNDPELETLLGRLTTKQGVTGAE